MPVPTLFSENLPPPAMVLETVWVAVPSVLKDKAAGPVSIPPVMEEVASVKLSMAPLATETVLPMLERFRFQTEAS